MRTLTSLLALLIAAPLVHCQTADSKDYVFESETGGSNGSSTGGRGSPSSPVAGSPSSSAGGSTTSKRDRPVGEECSSNAECGSGRCLDGVCCDRSCANCDACRFALTGKSDGTCAPVLAGQDPHEACEDEAATNPCGNDGTCDGEGACRKVGTSHVCAESACSGGSFVPAATCDGQGECSTPLPEACGVSVCTATGCRKSCVSQNDCGSASYCKLSGGNGTCTAKKPSGAEASEAFECLSKVVADGVCCDRSCTGCQACSGAPLTTAPKGQCSNIVAGRIAHDACEESDEQCGTSGTCDGTGACAMKTGPCDDGDGCTLDDSCLSDGTCKGIARTCDAAPACYRSTTCSEGACNYTELVPDGDTDAKCPVLMGRCFQGTCVRCAKDENCSADSTCDPLTHECVSRAP